MIYIYIYIYIYTRNSRSVSEMLHAYMVQRSRSALQRSNAAEVSVAAISGMTARQLYLSGRHVVLLIDVLPNARRMIHVRSHLVELQLDRVELWMKSVES